MEMGIFHILGVLLMLAAITESGVIGPKEDPSGDGEIPLALNKFDKKLGLSPEIGQGDDFGVYDYDTGAADPNAPPDYGDYVKPGDGNIVNEPDKNKPGIIKPGKIPPSDEKPVDEEAYEPFEGEEDLDKSVVGGGKDKLPDDVDADKKVPLEDVDDDKKVPEDEGEEKPVEEEEEADEVGEPKEEGDEEKPEEADEPEEKPDDNEPKEEGEEEDHVIVDDDEKHDEDEEPDKDDEKIGGGEESGFFSGGSMFDTPFFNLNQVQKYFSQLERALGHVFKQTLDEAALLNGTYANTTEEEVEINGKKYIIQKSVIKGADNHSSIYVEALSSKSKMNDTQEVKDIVIKNETHV